MQPPSRLDKLFDDDIFASADAAKILEIPAKGQLRSKPASKGVSVPTQNLFADLPAAKAKPNPPPSLVKPRTSATSLPVLRDSEDAFVMLPPQVAKKKDSTGDLALPPVSSSRITKPKATADTLPIIPDDDDDVLPPPAAAHDRKKADVNPFAFESFLQQQQPPPPPQPVPTQSQLPPPPQYRTPSPIPPPPPAQQTPSVLKSSTGSTADLEELQQLRQKSKLWAEEFRKMETRAQDAEAALKVLKKKEAAEAQTLEGILHSVEQQLTIATARAEKAEIELTRLHAEVARLQRQTPEAVNEEMRKRAESAEARLHALITRNASFAKQMRDLADGAEMELITKMQAGVTSLRELATYVGQADKVFTQQ